MDRNINKCVIFVGRFYPQKLYNSIIEESYSKISFSNHNFEMSLLNGLYSHNYIEIVTITLPAVYSFPYNNKRVFVRPEKYKIKGKEIYSIGFINIPILNKVQAQINLLIRLFKIIVRNKNKKIVLLVNTPNFYIELTALIIKKIFRKNVYLSLIIPDIPSLISKSSIKNIIKYKIVSIIDSMSMKLAQMFDYYILLTENMTDFFSKKIKYIVMEGLIDIDYINTIDNQTSVSCNNYNKVIFLYTGTLQKTFGIMNLIKAFESGSFINSELWICGSGEAVREISDLSKKNKSIKYFGLLNSYETRILQNKATILVNPRTSDGIYTKYSFPSKTIEYFLAGKAVIMNKLPGIPKEYYDFIFTPEDESVESLKKTMENISQMEISILNNKGIKAREFIVKNKNSKIQTKRILDLILTESS